MGNGVVRTYGFIKRMGSQTQYGFCSAKFVGVSSQREPTQPCQEVAFPERRSFPSCITWQKASDSPAVGGPTVDNEGYADWWEYVEIQLVV